MEFDLFHQPPAPAPAPHHAVVGRIPLRWCQRQDTDALMAAIEGGASRPCCVAATGYGKGAMIAEMVGRLRVNGKVVCLIDRAHLVNQLADEIERHLDISVGRVADGQCTGLQYDVVCATVQAMYTPDRSGRPLYEYPQFKKTAAVIADEAHKFFADCFRAVLNHFVAEHSSVIPLFTATPVAANGARWQSFVDWTPGAEGPCMRTAGWCIRNGYLVPPTQAFIRSSLDLASVHDKLRDAGDAEEEDKGDELSDLLIGLLEDKGERAAAEFAAGVADVIGERQAIVFSPARVTAAKLLASWLSATGRLRCDPVWGARADKADVLARFKRGTPQVLANVNLLTEGYDNPHVSAVFICRLLKEWRLIAQMVGRGLRPHPSIIADLSRLDSADAAAERCAVIANSVKPDALIADLVGIDGKIMQASAIEVLYGEESDDVKQVLGERAFKRQADRTPREDEPPTDAEREAARQEALKRQHDQLTELARRRAMAGELPAHVSVSYDGQPHEMPTIPTPKAGATLGERARYVALAIDYDPERAKAIAERTPRNVLRGMTASAQRKLNGRQADWRRAREAYPEWAKQKAGR